MSAPTLDGSLLIGSSTQPGAGTAFTATDPTSRSTLAPTFRDATSAQVEEAVALAAAACTAFENAGRQARADLLRRIAERIEALGDTLLERAGAETGLPAGRLQNERGRTCNQLRLFATQVENGSCLDVVDEPADPERQPLPRPGLRRVNRALGPVVVFGASNFPLAFSVAGGDTASALAAGCPVVVKAHPRHPGTSELVGRAIQEAVTADPRLPEGTFSMVHGSDHSVGLALAQHPDTRAVAFTGSLGGGRALLDAAAARSRPIPVFAEMGAVNPVFLLARRLQKDPEGLAKTFAGSVALGVGQFCTCPGLIAVPAGDAADRFVATLTDALAETPAAPMLHDGIHAGFRHAFGKLAEIDGVEALVTPQLPDDTHASPGLATTTGARVSANPEIAEEVFGPSTLVVRCEGLDGLVALAEALPGQLTATLHADDEDLAAADSLMPLVHALEQRAGRLVFNSVPTGVEVAAGMVHGGPWPATTDARFTSVGTQATMRFLRPVCYQDWPEALLPADLRP